MALSVVPFKNYLGTSDNPYFVRTECSDTVDFDRLVDLMASGRTTLTKPDIWGCLQLYMEELAKLLADGKFVKTNIGAFYLCGSGKLDAIDQAFTPGEGASSHSLRLHFRPDKSFEAQLCARTTVERGKRYDRNTPLIASVASVKSETEMRSAAGDFLRIAGQRLKFDKANAVEGLFFVNGTETRAVQYASITPSLCIAQVPAELQAGPYALVLRSCQGGKDLHEGRVSQPFVVE